MTGRLALLLAAMLAGCRGQSTTTLAPATAADVLARFLDAVRTNDIHDIGQLWGNGDGPAAGWMKADILNKRAVVMQKALAHSAYRVLDGPAPVSGRTDVMAFRVELRRQECVHVQPIDVVRTRQGRWVVYDVHVEELPGPLARCAAEQGTPR